MASWMVGVTTVPTRRDDLLPKTLLSLERAGFPKPRLFMDGQVDAGSKYLMSVRDPVIRLYANWMLGLWELYARSPRADFFAMFQDDVDLCRDVREHCERFPGWAAGERAYLNLFTTCWGASRSKNTELAQAAPYNSWFRSNQAGSGAIALVFPNHAVRALLGSKLMVGRPWDDATQGWRNLDGGISEALCRSEQEAIHEPYTEWCHRPSLAQHIGQLSTVDKRKDATDYDPEWIARFPFRWPAESFAQDWPGPDWSPLEHVGRRPGAEPDEWEAERNRIRAAIAGDERRRDEAKTADERHRYEGLIAGYRARLDAHDARRPAR